MGQTYLQWCLVERYLLYDEDAANSSSSGLIIHLFSVGHDNAGFSMISVQVASYFLKTEAPCSVVYTANFVDDSKYYRWSTNDST